MWQPTDDDRDSFVKSEIDPMLRDVAAMQAVLLTGKEDTLSRIFAEPLEYGGHWQRRRHWRRQLFRRHLQRDWFWC